MVSHVELSCAHSLLLQSIQHRVNLLLPAAEQGVDPPSVDDTGAPGEREGEVEQQQDLHLAVEWNEDGAQGVGQTLHGGEEGEDYPVHHTLDLTNIRRC